MIGIVHLTADGCGRRIDLVVRGAQGRLAVECHGDRCHGTSEHLENDLDRERELKRAGWQFWRVRESELGDTIVELAGDLTTQFTGAAAPCSAGMPALG